MMDVELFLRLHWMCSVICRPLLFLHIIDIMYVCYHLRCINVSDLFVNARNVLLYCYTSGTYPLTLCILQRYNTQRILYDNIVTTRLPLSILCISYFYLTFVV